MNPLISIIIPVYNAEQYLERCIDSVIGQTYKNLEIILVDDGSKDTSPVICDKYAAQDVRFKVIHKKNMGASAARNDGIDIATGEFLMFLDADDWVDSLFVESFLKYKNYPLIISGYKRFGAVNDERRPAKDMEISITDLPKVLKDYTKADDYWIFVWGKMYRTEIIKRMGLKFCTSMKYLEDSCFVIDYLSQVETVKIIDTKYLHHLLEKTKYSKYYMDFEQLREHLCFQMKSFRKLEEKCHDECVKFKEDISRLHFNNFRRYLLWSNDSMGVRLKQLICYYKDRNNPEFQYVKYNKIEKFIAFFLHMI